MKGIGVVFLIFVMLQYNITLKCQVVWNCKYTTFGASSNIDITLYL